MTARFLLKVSTNLASKDLDSSSQDSGLKSCLRYLSFVRKKTEMTLSNKIINIVNYKHIFGVRYLPKHDLY